MNISELAFRSWICRNIPNTTFLLTLIAEKYPKYRLLLAIHHYNNREYRRSLQLLNGIDTVTSVYYECLNLLEIGEEQECIQLLENLISNKFAEDKPFGNSFDLFMIKKTDFIFMIHLIAEAHVMNHNSNFALPYIKQAHKIFPLFTSFNKILAENQSRKECDNFKWDELIKTCENNNLKTTTFLKSTTSLSNTSLSNTSLSNTSLSNTLLSNTSLSNNTSQNDIIFDNECILVMLKEFYDDYRSFTFTWNKRLVEKYKKRIPGIGSIFVSYAGKIMSDVGKMKLSSAYFELVRSYDETFMDHMDVYSTTLWQLKNTTTLGLLGKEMLRLNRFNYICWSVLGNFFSQYNDQNRAIICFKRSIRIKRNPYAYALLGHESLLRNDYPFAMECFRSAIKMHPQNFNAYFGLGLVESKMGEFEAANLHLTHAIKLNPFNKTLKFIYLQVLNKFNKKRETVEFLKNSFLTKNESSADNKDLKQIAKQYLERTAKQYLERNAKQDLKEIAENDFNNKKNLLDKSLNNQTTLRDHKIKHLLTENFINELIKALKKSREEIDELILLEIVDLLINEDLLDLAKIVIENIRVKSKLYYLKRNMVYTKVAQKELGNSVINEHTFTEFY
ncbi:Protein bimA [Dictyocoela muelleri]|nr:Protein bimA [Dictyocoela muelleri]